MNGVPPGIFNQAIMNFGALVCRPKVALCDSCPLAKKCYAFQNNMVYILPLRSKKNKNKIRYFNFIVIHYRNKILLQRRTIKDIWHGLYAPPVLERTSARSPTINHIFSLVENATGHKNMERLDTSSPTRQLLSHQTIIGRFFHVKLLSPPIHISDTDVWVSNKTINNFGKPKIVVDMLGHAPV